MGLLFLVFFSGLGWGSDFGSTVGRLPVLVESSRASVLVRVITGDRRLAFQICPVDADALSSEGALVARVNGDLACPDVGSHRLDLGDASTVTAFESEYPSALDRQIERVRSRSILTAIDAGMIAGVLSGGAVFLADKYKINPFGTRALSAALVGGLSLASFFESAHLIHEDKRSLRERPPNVAEQDIVQLVKAREVTNPDNFASPLVFRCVGGAIRSAMSRAAALNPVGEPESPAASPGLR